MDENKRKASEAAGLVIRTLANINVPICFYDQIATPIKQAILELGALQKALIIAEQKAEEGKDDA